MDWVREDCIHSVVLRLNSSYQWVVAAERKKMSKEKKYQQVALVHGWYFGTTAADVLDLAESFLEQLESVAFDLNRIAFDSLKGVRCLIASVNHNS